MALLRTLWVSRVSLVPGWGNGLISAASSLWTIPSMLPLFLSEAEKSTWIWISCTQRGGCDSEGAPAPNVPQPYFNSGLFWINFHLWQAALSHTFRLKYRQMWRKSDSLWWLGLLSTSFHVCCWVAEQLNAEVTGVLTFRHWFLPFWKVIAAIGLTSVGCLMRRHYWL